MESINKPNITGPRFRPQTHNIFNDELVKKFKEKYPKYKNIESKVLKSLIKDFNETIYQTVIDTRDGVALPESLGWLFIGTCHKSKKENIDFAKSHKYGVRVTNKNWESDGKLAKIFYSNFAPKVKIQNREFWGFTACRNFKRLVAKTYPENWQMYITVDPNIRLHSQYNKEVTKASYKDFMQKKTNKALETYNEFDL
jgi:hypothetical protein